MTETVTGSDMVLRLALTVAAGLLFGLDREERGRPAGLRTTLLVSLAGCLSMLLANILFASNGSSDSSLAKIDPMRLPLGTLTGMGFIGGGTILRQKNRIQGVTTAATLWAITIIGICFGGGYVALGTMGTVAGLTILCGLGPLEQLLNRDLRGEIVLRTDGSRPKDLHSVLTQAGCHLEMGAVTSTTGSAHGHCIYRLYVSWRGEAGDDPVPPFVTQLGQLPGVTKVRWRSYAQTPKK
jgi:putative Mg2+ transporter-C (MgtC) family protein